MMSRMVSALALAAFLSLEMMGCDLGAGDALLGGEATWETLRTINIDGVTAITGGLHHSLALRSGGSVWVTGYNAYGQLGYAGSDTKRNSWVRAAQINFEAAAVAAGGLHSLVLKKDDGSVWVTGYNKDGQLGLGSTNNRTSWVRAAGLTGRVTAISAGPGHNLVLKEDGSVWAAGRNVNGEFGNGTTTNSATWTAVAGSAKAAVAGWTHSLLIASDDTLYATGGNQYGQLGAGDRENRTNWVQWRRNGTAVKVKAIAAGAGFSLVVDANGALWVTGDNYYGQLGTGDATSRDAWTRVTGSVVSDKNITAVSAGFNHSLARDSTGLVYAAGDRGWGQLGTVNVSGSQTTWVQVTQGKAISAGDYFSWALQSDGKLLATGWNMDGQLGIGDYTDRFSWTNQ